MNSGQKHHLEYLDVINISKILLTLAFCIKICELDTEIFKTLAISHILANHNYVRSTIFTPNLYVTFKDLPTLPLIM